MSDIGEEKPENGEGKGRSLRKTHSEKGKKMTEQFAKEKKKKKQQRQKTKT